MLRSRILVLIQSDHTFCVKYSTQYATHIVYLRTHTMHARIDVQSHMHMFNKRSECTHMHPEEGRDGVIKFTFKHFCRLCEFSSALEDIS